MIELIKKVLNKHKDIEWEIRESTVSSYELFFIKRNIEMNRCKDVKHYDATIFKAFDDLKASASMMVHPTMTETELDEVINEGIYAANFAKNKTYNLAIPQQLYGQIPETNMDHASLEDTAIEISNAIFAEDKYTEGWINACEIFVNRKNKRILNSNGVDYSAKITDAEVEYITTWKGKTEEVELYRNLKFSSLDKASISADVADTLKTARLRAVAEPMKSLEKVNVVFRSAEIEEMLIYFTEHCNVSYIYQNFSDWKVGKKLLKDNCEGDKISIKINPFLKGSTTASPFDNNGYTNEPIDMIVDGVVLNLWGPNVNGQYINYEAKVNNRNFEVKPGSLTTEEMNNEPYLEIVSMSGLQVDELLGSFCGEIRLAIYHDGDKETPYSGGSISGMISQNIDTWKFSKETTVRNNYHGPKYLEIYGAKILGK